MSTKVDLNERRHAVMELLNQIKEGGDDEYEKLLHQAAAANVEEAIDVGTHTMSAVFRTIEHVSRCPNPQLRSLQLHIWARVLEELSLAANELSVAIKKELKS